MQNSISYFLIILISTSFFGCGADSNILGLVIGPKDKESFEYTLGIAQAAYDANDLETAKKNIDHAYQLNPKSERAAVLYGFVYLSLAGADPFTLAQAMSGKKKTETTGVPLQDSSTSSSSSSTSDTLKDLKQAVGLTNDDLLALGVLDETDPTLPVIIPSCAESARRNLEKLKYINNAIYAACPFVDHDIRSDNDARQNCDFTEIVRENPSKAHFLWAFTHLTEALAFNAVLTYNGESDDKKTNLEKRVAKIKDRSVTDPADVTSFLEDVESLEKTVSAILPLKTVCEEGAPTSQLVATLNDMLAVDVAFKRIPGLPQKIQDKIAKAMEKLNKIQGDSGQIAGLKTDMTKKMSGALTDKIDALEEEAGELTEQQKTQICNSYSSISAGSETKPVLCGGTPEEGEEGDEGETSDSPAQE